MCGGLKRGNLLSVLRILIVLVLIVLIILILIVVLVIVLILIVVLIILHTDILSFSVSKIFITLIADGLWV